MNKLHPFTEWHKMFIFITIILNVNYITSQIKAIRICFSVIAGVLAKKLITYCHRCVSLSQ